MGLNGEEWRREWLAAKWKVWGSLVTPFLFYAAPMVVGGILLERQLARGRQPGDPGLFDLLFMPLYHIMGWFMLLLVSAYAIRRNVVTAVVSLGGMIWWFELCMFAASTR